MPRRSVETATETGQLSASENVARALEDEILKGNFKPGMRLDEQLIADRFGVSRTPVREALRNLGSAGLIELRQIGRAHV